jgi:two-component system chemotaxis response regulator CheY
MANVLCLDNSETIRKVVKDCVLDLGYDFYEAENGKKGLEMAESMDSIDLIILDWNMPVLSGQATLEAFRSNELYKDTLILALIKIEQKHRVVEVIGLGVDNYMLKPFSVNSLQDKIKEMIMNAA